MLDSMEFKILKLNDEQVIEVRKLVKSGMTRTAACMQILNVGVVTIYCKMCKNEPTEHEYIKSSDSFICLKCGNERLII